MDYRPTPGSDFEQLLIGLIEEALSAADRQRLAEILRADPQARQYYVRYVALHANLQTKHVPPPVVLPAIVLPAAALSATVDPAIPEIAGQRPANPRSPPAPPTQSPAKSPVLGFLGGVIDYVNHSRMLMFWLMALTVSGWFLFQLGSLMLGRARPGGAPVAGQPADPNSSDVSHLPGGSFANSASPRQSDSVAPTSVAWMTAIVDCHWRVVPLAVPPASAPAPGDADTHIDADHLFHIGSELSVGQQLDLVRGLAAITFRSGARIVLNGPAHFTVGSKLGGKLQIGKLTARVPHDAHGFTVDTPAGKVVDLGTEFGVAVAADHTMAVEVFVGQVAVDSSADGQTPGSPSNTPSAPLKLSAGHAARVVLGQPVVSIPLDPKRFVRGLGPREDSHVAQAAYLDFVRSLKPEVWFRMEGQDKDRVLHDEMGGPDAKLVWDGPGNPFVEGRLGKALWLRGPRLGDYAFVPTYPQAEHGKLSVSAWAYADSRPSNATIVANWGDGSRQFTLGLFEDGLVLAAHITQSNGTAVHLREGAAHPFPFNQWQHVAFTTDGSTMRLYREGREVAKAQHSGLLYPVVTKSLMVGAHQGKLGEEAKAQCWWDGRLDEIAIFNSVLTADDIRKLAAAPPQ